MYKVGLNINRLNLAKSFGLIFFVLLFINFSVVVPYLEINSNVISELFEEEEQKEKKEKEETEKEIDLIDLHLVSNKLLLPEYIKSVMYNCATLLDHHIEVFTPPPEFIS